jgi:lamin tail-like protein/CHU domain-containing protein
MKQIPQPIPVLQKTIARLLLSMLFLLSFLSSFSQVTDNFSDGNFSSDPVWNGNADQFIVNTSLQLQLSAEGSGESYLSTINHSINDVEWQFWAKLSFSPSANNNARVYLISDKENLNDSLNAYFLQLGEAGAEDAIELFRQSGTETFSICRASEGLISSSFEIRVKVQRDVSGNWKIYADYQGGDSFQFQTEGTDNTFSSTNFFGVFCKYTSSNSSKFYFDDFYVGPVIYDTLPPEITSFSLLSENSAAIIYSETVTKTSAENTSNYLLIPGNIHPINCAQNPENPARVLLTFADDFESETNYTLKIDNIEDLEGNRAMGLRVEFAYYFPQPFDVVINEIMADPTPPIGLPEFEYLELVNNSNFGIDLNNWTLTIGASEKKFQDQIISAGGYLIVAKEDAMTELSPFGEFYGFSSFSLSNAGQDLVLRDQNGSLMSEVFYQDTWYKDPDKGDGGWALEQINPFNPCETIQNWKAAMNLTGGTPGTQNSVFSLDFNNPEILRVSVINNRTFEVFFSQIMDSLSLLNSEAFEIDRGMGQPQTSYVSSDNSSSLMLVYDDEMQAGLIYELSTTDTLYNCAGIPLEPGQNMMIGIPAKAENKDLVINEILFNPLSDGVDYVELYNRSEKIIDLHDLLILSIKDKFPNPTDTSFAMICTESFLFFPEEYIVLSKNQVIVKDRFFTDNPEAFVDVDGFPDFSNDQGRVLIIDQNKNIIDDFFYTEDMQYPLLNYFDGVALERINFNRPSNEKSNWHSAAEYVGFGTPAYKNSQFVSESKIKDPVFVEPELFSPNNDGVDDNLCIHYKFDQAGFNASLSIFDASGNVIRALIDNQLLGTEGFFSWDGLDDSQQIAPAGIYIIYLEVFDLEGKTEFYKKTAVLAKKF